MKFTEIHAAIHKDFGAEVAMAAVQILTVSMVTKLKNSDIQGRTKWSERVLKKAKKVLWETSKEDKSKGDLWNLGTAGNATATCSPTKQKHGTPLVANGEGVTSL